MNIKINDLNDLENILESLIFEEEDGPEPFILNETDEFEFIETVLYLMEDYMIENPTAISEPYFEIKLLEDIKELFYVQFEEDILKNDWIEDDINEMLEEILKIYPNKNNILCIGSDI